MNTTDAAGMLLETATTNGSRRFLRWSVVASLAIGWATGIVSGVWVLAADRTAFEFRLGQAESRAEDHETRLREISDLLSEIRGDVRYLRNVEEGRHRTP